MIAGMRIGIEGNLQGTYTIPNNKSPGIIPEAYENKNPGWQPSPPGVLTIKF